MPQTLWTFISASMPFSLVLPAVRPGQALLVPGQTKGSAELKRTWQAGKPPGNQGPGGSHTRRTGYDNLAR